MSIGISLFTTKVDLLTYFHTFLNTMFSINNLINNFRAVQFILFFNFYLISIKEKVKFK